MKRILFSTLAHPRSARRLRLIAAMGLCAFLASGGRAQADPAAFCDGGVRFALYENGYIYEASTDRGIDKDVALELARRSGCRFEFVVQPRARIWHELELGGVMMTGSAMPTTERRSFAWFVTYMAQKNYVIVSRQANSHDPASFRAAPGLRWGAVRGYRHGAQADAFLGVLRQAGRVAEGSDLGEVFRLFSRGRTAAVMAPPPAYARYLRGVLNVDQVRIEDWFPGDPPIPHALAFSRRHFSVEQMAAWRRLVKGMREDGSLQAIYIRYLGHEDAERLMAFKPDE